MKTFKRVYFYCVTFIVFTLCFLHSQNNDDTSISDTKYIRFGFSTEFFTDVNIKDAVAATEVYIKQIAKKISDYKVKTETISSLPQLIKTINNNKLDVIYLPAWEYLAINEKTHLEPALTASLQAKILESYVLLIRKDSGISNLKKLRNTNIIISKGGKGKIALIWLNTHLLKNGLPESIDFFNNIKKVNRTSQAVLPVFFNQVNACIVTENSFNTMKELNPQIGKEIKILKNSPEFVFGIMCFRNEVGKNIKEVIIREALKLHEKPKGKQILTFFRVDRVIKFNESYLDSMKVLIKEYNALKLKLKMIHK